MFGGRRRRDGWGLGGRIQEGALSALKTPVNPPEPTRLVPLAVEPEPPPEGVPLNETTAPVHYEGDTSSV